MRLFLFTIINKIWNKINLKSYDWFSEDLARKITYFINYKLDPRFTVMIGLTYSCQCRCPHCGMSIYEKKSEDELTTEELLKFIETLSPKKTNGIYFFGGEPLLRNDIFQLINKAKEKGFLTMLDTNGYLLSQEMVKKLKKAGLDVIEVSIDHSDAKIHNTLRRMEGIFERAVEGIKNCLKERISCILSTYATREYIESGELKKIISLGEKLGVNFIRVLSPVLTGKLLNKEEMKLNNKERKKLKKIIKNSSVPIGIEDTYCWSKNKKLLYISPYGEVQPCPYIPFSFGNIREESLSSILERMWKHPMFKIKSKECLMNNKEFRERYLKEKLKENQIFPIQVD